MSLLASTDYPLHREKLTIADEFNVVASVDLVPIVGHNAERWASDQIGL